MILLFIKISQKMCHNWITENDVMYPIIDVNSYWKIQLHIQQLWQLDINIFLSLSHTHFSLQYDFHCKCFMYVWYIKLQHIFYFSSTWVMSWKLLNMTKSWYKPSLLAIIVRFCYQTHQIVLSFDMI